MRWSIVKILSIFSILLLTGCWDKAELTEYAFVQGAAVDLSENGKISLTTLFYKPGGGGQDASSQEKGARSVSIESEAESVFEAIRDIPIHLGRKAKWDHMRVLLVSEKFVKNNNIGEALDFFSRDHEPRGAILVMIAKDKPGSFFTKKPFIEGTIGQQQLRTEESGARFTAKTIQTKLVDLSMQMKSEVGIAMVPYTYLSARISGMPALSGMAVLKKGKMVDIISSTEVQPLLMLINKHQSGIIETPCMGQAKNKKLKEALEVLSVKTKIIPKIRGNSLTVQVVTKILGNAGELRCSTLMTKEQMYAFEKGIKKTVEKDMRKVVKHLQRKKLDVIGIGNKIYGKNPKVWKKWKDNWEDRFAHSQFEIHVEVKVFTTGTTTGKPFGK